MTCNKTIGKFASCASNEEADSILVSFVAALMSDKLLHKRDEGKGGWYRRPHFSRDCLEDMLTSHVAVFSEQNDDNQLIDIINIAGMLLVRSALYNDREKD